MWHGTSVCRRTRDTCCPTFSSGAVTICFNDFSLSSIGFEHTIFWLFVWFFFFVPFDNFSLIWRRHHDRWRASNFDLCSALIWPLSSEGSLALHTYCETGHLLVMVISKDPWHSHSLPIVAVESSLPVLSRLGFEHSIFRLRGERSNPLRPTWCIQGEHSNRLRHRRGKRPFTSQIGQRVLEKLSMWKVRS